MKESTKNLLLDNKRRVVNSFAELGKHFEVPDFKRDFHRWYYNSGIPPTTTFMGVPVHKAVTDLWNYQEIVWSLQPTLIVEYGTLYGGSAYYLGCLASQMGLLGPVLSVDIDHSKVHAYARNHSRVTLLESDSTSPLVAEKIARLRMDKHFGTGPMFMILDSDHSKKHVLAELESIRNITRKGDVVIVEDSNLNGHPVQPGWGPGPMEAVLEYESLHPDDYRHLSEREEKYGLTFAPHGYLERL